MHTSVHMSDQYGAIDNVIGFFVSMGPIQFVVYIVFITLFGYYINTKRITEKKRKNE